MEPNLTHCKKQTGSFLSINSCCKGGGEWRLYCTDTIVYCDRDALCFSLSHAVTKQWIFTRSTFAYTIPKKSTTKEICVKYFILRANNATATSYCLHNKTINEFYVLLTVHRGVTLGKWPTWCTITLYNTFTIIIVYMFRATLCSSSGGWIVLIQHLV